MKKLLSVILTAVFLASIFTFAAAADAVTLVIDEGSIVIGEAEDGVSLLVTQNDVPQTLSPDTVITVVGNAVTSNNITVKNNVSVSVVLNNVKIVYPGFLKSPFVIDNGENVKLTLIGENVFIANDYMAGLQTSKRSVLTVDGSGSLSAVGGADAAGIGGGWRTHTPGSDAGTIVIGGDVTVFAKGGKNGAGIGGGITGSARLIEISTSGTVAAIGGEGAAGIGSGSGGDIRQIKLVSAGNILTSGGDGGAGAGSGNGGSVTNVIVGAQTKLRAYGGKGAAGIGSGSNGSVSRIDLREDCFIRAMSGEGAAAIGTGEASTGSQITLTNNAQVFALGINGAGIGTGISSAMGSILIEQTAYVDAFGGDGAAAIGSGRDSTLESVAVQGNPDIFCIGGSGGAGIGGGANCTPKSITVAGGCVINTVGGFMGAGIGSGSGAAYPDMSFSGSAIITAQGGNYGAGIGSGAKESADVATPTAKITITDQVTADCRGGKDAAGIGGGAFGAGSILEISLNAKVTAVSDNTISVIDTSDGLSVRSPKADPVKLGELAVDSIPQTLPEPDITKLLAVPGTDPSPAQPQPQGAEDESFSYIIYAPSAAKFDAGQKKYEPFSVAANEAGNGAGCAVSGSIHISGGASLNGQFGDVTLTLVLGEGATDMVITLAQDSVYTLPESVTKTGYSFKGWYEDYDLTVPVSGQVRITEDKLIYAAWEAVQVELNADAIDPAFKDVPYSYKFTASAGSDSTSFVVTMGQLPMGVILTQDGTLTGTPVIAGKYVFTVAFLNSNGTSGAREVVMNVYTNSTYVFTVKTGDVDGAESKGDMMMEFDFVDRFTGERSTTQKVNLTEFLRAYYNDPLQKGATVELPMVFEPNVGEPTDLRLTSDSEDGWLCESVSVSFEGNETAQAFKKDFTFNSWIGREQNVHAGKIFLIVVISILALIIIAGLVFIAMTKFPRTRRFLKNHGFLRGKKKR